MGCLFSIFKLAYTILTAMVLIDHIDYIYRYFELLQSAERFFSNNQFAHTMGMFLGLLFRISGLLSAIKEKIALSTTYGLFLLMLLLLMTRVDHIFYLYLGTAVYAFAYVIALKFRRARARKAASRADRNRANRNDGNNSRNNRRQPPNVINSSSSSNNRDSANIASTQQVAIDLVNGGRAAVASAIPSAPPYEDPIPSQQQTSNQLPFSDLYLINPHHNTPPPSYSDLYQTK